jgi:hypothetical protein
MQLGQHFVVSSVESNHSASWVGEKDSGVALGRLPSGWAGKHLGIMVRQIKVDQVRERRMCLPGGEKSWGLVQTSIATRTNALDCTIHHLLTLVSSVGQSPVGQMTYKRWGGQIKPCVKLRLSHQPRATALDETPQLMLGMQSTLFQTGRSDYDEDRRCGASWWRYVTSEAK